MSTKSVFPIPKPLLRHHLVGLNGVTLPPVILLIGTPGVGKRAMAHHIAQSVFCDQNKTNQNFDPCQKCTSCKQALSGNWVDFIEVAPEETGTSIKVDALREIKSKQGFGGFDHDQKIILISQAERMTTQAANSVLKLLEEPPNGWIFILTTHDQTLLLPTIVSRCQIFRLKPIPTSVLQELLGENGVTDPQKQMLCAKMAQGSWGRALAYADETFWKYHNDILEFVKNPASTIHNLTDWAAQNVENIDFLANQLEDICYEQIKKSPTDTWLNRAEKIAQARETFHLPLNKKLLVQGLLLSWVQ
jgi:DNA polymerase-3 subunit delta'